MTTSRELRNALQNLLDYFAASELILNVSAIREVGTSSRGVLRLTFAQADEDVPFLLSAHHPDVDQYLAWVENNSYSILLLDGSILQLAYDVDTRRRRVVGHRLAYVPCPFDFDAEDLTAFPVADLVEECRATSEVLMRTPVRFDYDPSAAHPDHPAAHLSLNSVDCRIACVAPMHPYGFVDFVFRHFYPKLWSLHQPFFKSLTGGRLEHEVREVERPDSPYIAWIAHPSN